MNGLFETSIHWKKCTIEIKFKFSFDYRGQTDGREANERRHGDGPGQVRPSVRDPPAQLFIKSHQLRSLAFPG